MTTAELSVWGIQEGKHYFCNMKTKENHDEIDVFICEIQSTSNTEFQHLLVSLSNKLQQAKHYNKEYNTDFSVIIFTVGGWSR